MESRFDPEREPEKAQALAALLASGEYAEAIVHCPTCQGGFTAMVRHDALDRLSATCVFCGAGPLTVSTL